MGLSHNMVNCMLELVGILTVVLLGSSDVTTILYTLLTCTGTPVVYYLGMESNKKSDDQEAKSNIRVFKKQKSSDDNTTTPDSGGARESTKMIAEQENESEQEAAESNIRMFERRRSNVFSPVPASANQEQDVEMIDIEN